MNKVIQFMKATGNDFPVDIDRNQFFKQVGKLLPLLKEEVAELEDALIAKDVVETVDALSDIRVYMDQFNYLQDKAGIDRVAVNEAVDLNNSLKWTTSKDLALSWLFDLGYEDIGVLETNIRIEGADGSISSYKTYCLKDLKGKVRKFKDFPKVDLKEYIPVHLLEVKQYEWGTGAVDFDQLLDETSDS